MTSVTVRGRAVLSDGTVLLGTAQEIEVAPFSLWRESTQVGMSTPKSDEGTTNPEFLFEDRQADVEFSGGSLRAMRIFATLHGATPSLQHDRILYAKENGLIPDISYKATGTDAQVRAWFTAERDWMLANGITEAVVIYHHEPRPDIPAADYVRRAKILGEVFRPYPGFVRSTAMTSWVLDAPNATVRADFDNYMPVDLFAADSDGQIYVDSPGIDAYEAGTFEAPLGNRTNGSPSSRMRLFADWATARGLGHLPLAVHEFNGYRGTTFDWVHEYLFTDGGADRYWLALLWNSTGGVAVPLTEEYDRLGAFQRLLLESTERLV